MKTSYNSYQKPGCGGPHDVGGFVDGNDDKHIDTSDRPYQYWEKSIHALLVLLASKSPQLLTTDELRRSVENLEPSAYNEWGYYDKWGAAMAVILIERGVISQAELDVELGFTGEDECVALFQAEDRIRVRLEDGRIRWRKPHIRCPGYIFGAVGIIDAFLGVFEDPVSLAFRGVSIKSPLYRVRFALQGLWEGGPATTFSSADTVDVEVYQSWLEAVGSPADSAATDTPHSQSTPLPSMEDHEHRLSTADKIHDQKHHDHDHKHDHDHDHDHDHTNDNEHERGRVELAAIAKEGPDSPGRVVGEALIRILVSKEVITREGLRLCIERLDTAKDRLLGAHLVARAWVDDDFKRRLLADATSAALELGINTANPNAPTVLRVLENTPDTHHVVVCTLCSCYPSSMLGVSPDWYRSRNYRARMVREPRAVLAEFGTELSPTVRVRVVDSTADSRYLVLPMRPAASAGSLDEEQLRALVTRDSMIGVRVL